MKLIRVRLSARSMRLEVHVQLGGQLLMFGRSEFNGELESRGLIRYQLPAPLGTYVPGGVFDASIVELLNDASATSSPLLLSSGLPLPCLAGYLGNSEALSAQRNCTCHQPCPKGDNEGGGWLGGVVVRVRG